MEARGLVPIVVAADLSVSGRHAAAYVSILRDRRSSSSDPAITPSSMDLCSAPCNASALRADRYAASGIDSASAQLSVGTYVMAPVVRQIADG